MKSTLDPEMRDVFLALEFDRRNCLSVPKGVHVVLDVLLLKAFDCRIHPFDHVGGRLHIIGHS